MTRGLRGRGIPPPRRLSLRPREGLISMNGSTDRRYPPASPPSRSPQRHPLRIMSGSSRPQFQTGARSSKGALRSPGATRTRDCRVIISEDAPTSHGANSTPPCGSSTYSFPVITDPLYFYPRRPNNRELRRTLTFTSLTPIFRRCLHRECLCHSTETVMVMAKSNHRICAGCDLNPLQLRRLTAILDTGASRNFAG